MTKSISCVRILEFDAAHRIPKHENKCKNLHGHRYKVEFYFTTKDLDKLGRVVDFGYIKDVLKKWIDENVDHTTILCKKDKELGDFIEEKLSQKIFYLDVNPTAENIALCFLNTVCPLLFKDVVCYKVKLWETPNCYVEVEK